MLTRNPKSRLSPLLETFQYAKRPTCSSAKAYEQDENAKIVYNHGRGTCNEL
jgi:hypothetical protein